MDQVELQAVVASACIARGLTRDQSVAVWSRLDGRLGAAAFAGVFDAVDAAIEDELIAE